MYVLCAKAFTANSRTTSIGKNGSQLNYGVNALKVSSELNANLSEGLNAGFQASVIGGEVSLDLSNYIPFEFTAEAGIGVKAKAGLSPTQAKVTTPIIPGVYAGVGMKFKINKNNFFYKLGEEDLPNIFELILGDPENYYK